MEGVNGESLVKGALETNADVEMVSAPYQAHDVSLKSKRRHTTASCFSRFRDFKFAQDCKDKKIIRAAGYNDFEKVKEILKDKSVDPNVTDAHGRTALHVAASRGYSEVVQSLLLAGADPNVEDRLGNTPMHLAVHTGSVTTVSYLLEGGCRLRKTARLPYTPLQLAQSKYCLLQKQEASVRRRQETILSMLRRAIETDLFNTLTAEARKAEIDALLKGLSNIELADQSPVP